MWFRQDLRLRDNPALVAACQSGSVIPVYIYDDFNSKDYEMGSASKWWLHHSLSSLNSALDGNLTILKGDPLSCLQQIIKKTDADAIFWNRCYEPWQISRDKQVKSVLGEQGLKVRSFNGALLWEPWEIMNQSGLPYKVFTPYYRKGCLKASSLRNPIPAPSEPTWYHTEELGVSLDALDLLPSIHWYEGMENRWKPGENGAANNLSTFLSSAVEQYKQARDEPAQNGTSYLSPHLHFGEISPHQIWYAILDKTSGSMESVDVDCYLSELGWREFSHYLLYHFPTLPKENFNQKFNAYPWSGENEHLQAWQKGQTGVPIVDAGMRELWQTGYMHNRVRMIVGSYLVKNLKTHWHHGERWFWDCLLDADLAANSASWQWVAGSGADAAPFFRIFNPVTQGERFDKHGEYVRKYCPELSRLPDKYIHQPWEAPKEILNYAGIVLGKDYPQPLVDLKVSRKQALEAYELVKNAVQAQS